MVYMYCVPKALGQHRGVVFDGQVVYRGHPVEIPALAVEEGFVGQMARLIGHLTSSIPARRVQSLQECGWCEISGADCPERQENSAQEGQTDDF